MLKINSTVFYEFFSIIFIKCYIVLPIIIEKLSIYPIGIPFVIYIVIAVFYTILNIADQFVLGWRFLIYNIEILINCSNELILILNHMYTTCCLVLDTIATLLKHYSDELYIYDFKKFRFRIFWILVIAIFC